MSNFDRAIPVILAHEGTPTKFWVDDPNDAGGETVWGISMLMIKREGITAEELGIPNLEPGALKNVSLDTVKGLYKKFFWDKWGYGSINDQTVATKLFDCSVNCGPKNAHLLGQRAANDCGQDIIEDGILGPHTVVAINSCDPEAWVKQMASQMAAYYESRVKARPQNAEFLKNWLHRAAWGT